MNGWIECAKELPPRKVVVRTAAYIDGNWLYSTGFRNGLWVNGASWLPTHWLPVEAGNLYAGELGAYGGRT